MLFRNYCNYMIVHYSPLVKYYAINIGDNCNDLYRNNRSVLFQYHPTPPAAIISTMEV